MVGAMHGVTIKECSFEGFVTTNSYAISLTPATGDYLAAIVIRDNYFEKVAGYCIVAAPTDAGGIRALQIKGNTFWGGHASHFSSSPNYANTAIFVHKTVNTLIEGNNFDDFEDNLVGSTGENFVLEIVRNTYPTGLVPYLLSAGTDTDVKVARNYERSGTSRNPEIFGSAVVCKYVELLYVGGGTTPNAADGNEFVLTMTNSSPCTINAPTNGRAGQSISLTIRNASAGALGIFTWSSAFKLAAWVNPASAKNRTITFRYDGTNWVEKSRTPADVPN
jgi:hypothetical protein